MPPELVPVEHDPFADQQPGDQQPGANMAQMFEAAANRTRQSVQPDGGRQEGTLTKFLDATGRYLGEMPYAMASLPQRAGEAAAIYARTGEYDPEPIVKTALMMVGTPGVPARALGANLRAFHNSSNPARDFAAARSRQGNSFGPAVYVAPSPQKTFGPHTYELNVGGKEAIVDVSDAADVARFNREFGTNMQLGGYFDKEAEADKLPSVIRGSGFDRLDVRNGDKMLESAVYNPAVIDILRKYGLAGLSVLPPATAAAVSQRLAPVDHDPFAQPAAPIQ